MPETAPKRTKLPSCSTPVPRQHGPYIYRKKKKKEGKNKKNTTTHTGNMLLTKPFPPPPPPPPTPDSATSASHGEARGSILEWSLHDAIPWQLDGLRPSKTSCSRHPRKICQQVWRTEYFQGVSRRLTRNGPTTCFNPNMASCNDIILSLS